MAFDLEPVSFSELPGWQQDDPTPVIDALRRCHHHVTAVKPYRTGSLGVTVADLLPAYEAAGAGFSGAAAARAFFEDRFVPFRIRPDDGGKGFVTAFYEPEVEVRATADAEFRFPFYRRPADLIDIDDANRPEGMDPYFVFGRLRDGRIEEYSDRRAIDEGLLAGRGLEIAYARSKVDVFFIHVQGAARLIYPDGTRRRITYAAKTGHRFSAIGKLLIERGEIDPATVSMASIRDWLAAHPAKVDEVLWHNRSFIFFREASVEDESLGPVAAAKVPLEPGRSLAVDRLIHTFGVPFYIASETLTHLDGGRPLARLMLALDTGSAIVGPARGDIFTGSGEAAGALAGSVRAAADFFILVPRAAAARYRHG
ncbi:MULTISPECIES: murein transglycosylase A [Sinorhizobium]|uniref:peptidoglycan lytic exotransglycosylase n=1 Tax=Sinorhizobium americanum TaxID=194963 RepID=A0A2S3YIB3_9HYPH|nr:MULTISPECIES: murein transglycosylase A [Sinorhizobium]PDT40900.1 transglycosylase [Sinorhizobium sp. FG01]PDT52004.1 transglycosylase [Sinorhizobium sp. NG07B]POH26735.1 transglycosylase [Sinorhizobium americanum]POH27319.1 transglycosylase [Sinorhizobium americanum]